MKASTGRVGVAASSAFLEMDDGWAELRAALTDVGLDPLVIVWDDEARSYGPLDIVVVNYCWGYVTRRDDFLGWAERIATEALLVNPLPVLRWNSKKTYLRDLEAAGVPVVPTMFVAPGEAWRAPAEDYVVKPVVGSGGWWAARYATSSHETADRHIRSLHAEGQTVMLQPYQRNVDSAGETAMIFLGGEFSHAVHKAPLLDADVGVVDALWERQVITPVEPSGAHLNAAEAAVRAVGGLVGDSCYARVDVVDGNEGTPLVLEVELIEPSLFLPSAEGAAFRFARVLAGLAAGDESRVG